MNNKYRHLWKPPGEEGFEIWNDSMKGFFFFFLSLRIDPLSGGES